MGLIAPNVDVGTGYYVGLLVDFLVNRTVTNCFAEEVSFSGDYRIGGLVGYSGWDSKITNCYATCNVSGTYGVAGLVRGNYGGGITNCYSAGSVSGNNDVGGLKEYNEQGEIIDSFWDIETNGHTSSAGGTGLPKAEMQMAGTFIDAGWDFVSETFNGVEDNWFIPQQDAPHLWWEEM